MEMSVVGPTSAWVPGRFQIKPEPKKTQHQGYQQEQHQRPDVFLAHRFRRVFHLYVPGA